MAACPSHAIYRTPEGVVVVDESRCVGARACVSACPYGSIFFLEDGGTYYPGYETPYEAFRRRNRKVKIAIKCDFCIARVRDGREPACVEACPTEARIFGDLDDPNSKIAQYLKTRVPRVEPKTLRPEAGTKPKVLYLL
jgi:molybdopterin-containing oxidoreductase family iron-sulfur binding subunit